MIVRRLKLAVASGVECDEIKILNKFFNDLFIDVEISYTYDTYFLVFIKNNEIIMIQKFEDSHLMCKYDGFWNILNKKYSYEEIQKIIQYMILTKFDMDFKIERIMYFMHI